MLNVTGEQSVPRSVPGHVPTCVLPDWHIQADHSDGACLQQTVQENKGNWMFNSLSLSLSFSLCLTHPPNFLPFSTMVFFTTTSDSPVKSYHNKIITFRTTEMWAGFDRPAAAQECRERTAAGNFPRSAWRCWSALVSPVSSSAPACHPERSAELLPSRNSGGTRWAQTELSASGVSAEIMGGTF